MKGMKASWKSRLGHYLVLALLVSLLALPIVPVSATTAPTSVNIDSIYVNRNLLATGDMLITVEYNIVFAAPPAETVTDLFGFRIFATDNVTEIGAVTAYSYPIVAHGLPMGLVSFYFTAAAVPAMVWNTAYPLHISGDPAYFAAPPEYTIYMQASDYSTSTNQSDDLALHILNIAQTLQAEWGVSLLTQSDVGTVLSAYGEDYFREAIPGIQSMAPTLFLVQVGDPDYEERVWSTTTAATYENRFNGTWVGDTLTAGATFMGFTGANKMFGTSIPIVTLMLLVIGLSTWAFEDADSGLMSCAVVMMVGVLLGMFPFAMMAVVVLLCAVIDGYIWFLRTG